MSITLSVPPAIVQEVRAYAARNGTSLNQLVRDYLTALVSTDSDCSSSAEEFERFARRTGSTTKHPYRFRRSDAYEEELG